MLLIKYLLHFQINLLTSIFICSLSSQIWRKDYTWMYPSSSVRSAARNTSGKETWPIIFVMSVGKNLNTSVDCATTRQNTPRPFPAIWGISISLAVNPGIHLSSNMIKMQVLGVWQTKSLFNFPKVSFMEKAQGLVT